MDFFQKMNVFEISRFYSEKVDKINRYEVYGITLNLVKASSKCMNYSNKCNGAVRCCKHLLSRNCSKVANYQHLTASAFVSLCLCTSENQP